MHGPFDVVLANILPDVLVPLADADRRHGVADGGTHRALSGILRELADGVEAAYLRARAGDDARGSTKRAGARW